MRQDQNSMQLIENSEFSDTIKIQLVMYLNALRGYITARNDTPQNPLFNLQTINQEKMITQMEMFKTISSPEDFEKIKTLIHTFEQIELQTFSSSSSSSSTPSDNSLDELAGHQAEVTPVVPPPTTPPRETREEKRKMADEEEDHRVYAPAPPQLPSGHIDLPAAILALYKKGLALSKTNLNTLNDEKLLQYFESLTAITLEYDQLKRLRRTQTVPPEADEHLGKVEAFIKKTFDFRRGAAHRLCQKTMTVTYKDPSRQPTAIKMAKLPAQFSTHLKELSDQSYRELFDQVSALANHLIFLKMVLRTTSFHNFNTTEDPETQEIHATTVANFTTIVIQLKTLLQDPPRVITNQGAHQVAERVMGGLGGLFKDPNIKRKLAQQLEHPLKGKYERHLNLLALMPGSTVVSTPSKATSTTSASTSSPQTNNNADYVITIDRLFETVEEQMKAHPGLESVALKQGSIKELELFKAKILEALQNSEWGPGQQTRFDTLLTFIGTEKAKLRPRTQPTVLPPSQPTLFTTRPLSPEEQSSVPTPLQQLQSQQQQQPSRPSELENGPGNPDVVDSSHSPIDVTPSGENPDDPFHPLSTSFGN